MKYAAIWAIVTAVLILIVGGAGLLVQWVSTDPSKAWLIVVVLAAVLIGIIAASIEYLSDQPRTSQEAKQEAKQAAIEAARNRQIG